jgi:hypothetical protein
MAESREGLRYEPAGFRFRDANYGDMVYVTEGHMAGWLSYRHPDGYFVSLRKATPEDLKRLGIGPQRAEEHRP